MRKSFKLFLLLFLVQNSFGQENGIIATSRIIQTFNPLDVSASIWLDGADKSKQISTKDNLGIIVDRITDKAGLLTSTDLYSGGDAFRTRTRNNGEGLYCNGSQGFILGSSGDFNYLHNSNGFTLYIVFKQLPLADQTTAYPIFRTKGAANQVGLDIGYYNRSGTGNQKTFQISISNGVSNQFLINGSANSVVDNEYNVLKIKFTGTSLQAWVKPKNGSFTSIGIDNTGSTSSSNSALALNLGTIGTSWRGYMKHFVAFNRVLNSTDETLIDQWTDNEMKKVIIPQDVNVYLSGPAQSNFWGRGANGSAASDLLTGSGALTWYQESLTTKGMSYWTELRVGVSSNPDSGETYHGMMNRFGYNMQKVDGNQTLILGLGQSSTPLKLTASTSDFNISGVETTDCFPKWKNNLTTWGLESIVHILRKNPVVRGMICMQGEQDAVNDGSVYQTDLENWIKSSTDWLITLGYDTTKMRVFIFRIANHYPSFNSTYLSQVRTAQVNVGSQTGGVDFSSYIPSKIKSITWSDTDSKSMNGDNLHYSAAGCDSMGQDLYNYYKLYVSE